MLENASSLPYENKDIIQMQKKEMLLNKIQKNEYETVKNKRKH